MSEDDARALDNLDGLAFLVLAQTGPFTESLTVLNLDERDFVLFAESGDQLGVSRFVAAVGENAENGVTAIQSYAQDVQMSKNRLNGVQ